MRSAIPSIVVPLALAALVCASQAQAAASVGAPVTRAPAGLSATSGTGVGAVDSSFVRGVADPARDKALVPDASAVRSAAAPAGAGNAIAVQEPNPLLLLLAGLAAVGWIARRRSL